MTKGRGIHEMHGACDTRAYRIWCAMRNRCGNKSNPAYPNYGGRGIEVCKRWAKFSNFIADMGDPPAGQTLERVDNDKGYSPANCVWADRVTQGRNKRNNVLLTVDGVTAPLAWFAEKSGLKYGTVHQRLRKGWSHKDAVSISLITKRAGIKRGEKLRKFGTEHGVAFLDETSAA